MLDGYAHLWPASSDKLQQDKAHPDPLESSMQYTAYVFLRISIPRTSVNKGKRVGASLALRDYGLLLALFFAI
jgi:hypothetical protein